MSHLQRQAGLTLVELMIAITLTVLLVSGIAGAYLTIKMSVRQVEALENAQEVIRGAHSIFSRSIKRASAVQLHSDTAIELSFQNEQADMLACNNSAPVGAFTEVYRLQGNQLLCDYGTSSVILLAGIEALSFSLRADVQTGTDTLLIMLLAPRGLPENFQQSGMTQPAVRLDFALKSVILQWAT